MPEQDDKKFSEIQTFGTHLERFVDTIDIVTVKTFEDIMLQIGKYVHKELDLNYFELAIPSMVNNKAGLQAKCNYIDGTLIKDPKYSSELYEDDKEKKILRNHSALAYSCKRKLWVVSESKQALKELETVIVDLCGNKPTSLPPYKPAEELIAKISIIIPLCSKGNEPIGVVDFEGERYIEPTKPAIEELTRLARSISKLLYLREVQETQGESTDSAIKGLASILESGTLPKLGKPRLFFAYPERAEPDVMNIIHKVLESISQRIRVIDWKEHNIKGNIDVSIIKAIAHSRFGICYLSEPIPGRKNKYMDNPNVLFEAGMLQSDTSLGNEEHFSWIPIREDASLLPNPFDIAHLKQINICRTKEGNEIVEPEKLKVDLKKWIEVLIGPITMK